MKEMILAAFFALTLTAGIASLADGAAVLINASSHSDPHDNTTKIQVG
jgi:X-X-X-Leu-X-X-Gly heptad repeat protein